MQIRSVLTSTSAVRMSPLNEHNIKCNFGPNYEACGKYNITIVIVIKVIDPPTKEKSHLRLHFSTYDENKPRSF